MSPYRHDAKESGEYDDTKWCAACESQQPVFHDFNRCGKPMSSCSRKCSCDCVECTLRADLARVTAELAGAQEGVDTLARLLYDERIKSKATRAQVRELLKVARAAAEWKAAQARPIFNILGMSVTQPLWDAVDALPPSVLEEPSDE